MLQTRDGKRTSRAAFKMAVDMVQEGLISRKVAITRIDAGGVSQFLQPLFDTDKFKEAVKTQLIARGLPAGPGAACGRVAFNSADAKKIKDSGDDAILVRTETSPEDIAGMSHAVGILTVRGGMTSHAALVGRQMGKTAVVGAERLKVDYERGELTHRDRSDVVVRAGDWMSLDGTGGRVLSGKIETMPSEVLQVMDGRLSADQSADYQMFSRILKWADQYRVLGVRMNCDTGAQALVGLFLGAEGIGLCRTEHMFFEDSKIDSMRKFILADSEASRDAALAELEPLQKADFLNLFKTLGSRPVTIRLLDPPLHEFLPKTESELAKTAKKLQVSVDDIVQRSKAMSESNSMLGFRGVRVGLVYTGLTAMQTRAAVDAACDAHLQLQDGAGVGVQINVEIMIPLVVNSRELEVQAALVRRTADAVLEQRGMTDSQVLVKIGSMLETPRACLTANELAPHMQFASFGSNDLTQSTLMLSRDDAFFVPQFVEQGLYPGDPFQSIDVAGVGQLVRMAVERAASVKHFGVCGEHGGDPWSIQFFSDVGLNYVSCSPFRVPVARLAAAQAAIKQMDAEELMVRHHHHHHKH